MSALSWLLLVPSGALGALARHGAGRTIANRLGAHAPWGVLAVNLVGAFLLGVLVGAGIPDAALTALGTGFLGSFTTFSTWMVEIDALAVSTRWRFALANAVVPAVLGFALAAAGYAVGSALA